MDEKMRVIIWGFKNPNDTFHWIHNGWYQALKHLGEDVHWIAHDNYADIVRGHELAKNAVVIFEDYQSYGLPLSKTNKYFVHTLRKENIPNYAQYDFTDLRYSCEFQDHDRNYVYYMDRWKMKNIGPSSWYDPDAKPFKSIYLPWATDLLPHQINLEDRFIPRTKTLTFVGTRYHGNKDTNTRELDLLRFICQNKGIEFKLSNPWIDGMLSLEENRRIIQESYLAPDIRAQSNINRGYLPCRIMKNISYGQIGLTNSLAIHQAMEYATFYHSDLNELFKMGEENMTNYDRIADQMNLVKDKHTYISRWESLLSTL